MNDETEKKLERLFREAAPLLKSAAKIVPPEHGREALNRVLDQVFPSARELTFKEMEALLLTILGEKAMDGYEIATRLRKANIRPKEGGDGVIYGVLSTLVTSGCLKVEMREDEDRMAKVYHRTEKGAEVLQGCRTPSAQLSTWSQAVFSVS